MEGKTRVRNWGESEPKTAGEVAPDFDSRFGGLKPLVCSTVETVALHWKLVAMLSLFGCFYWL